MGIQKLLPGIQRNISLKNYTTFRIGGPVKYFFVAKNKEDLIKAIKVAKKLNPSPFPKGDRVKLPFFILGGGSNLLVSDKGFNGLVIKTQNTKYKIRNTKIMAEAGVMLGELVNILAKAGMSGLEWAVGIPGTTGGAIWGNAGAFNKSMKDVVKSVEALEVKNEKCKVKNFKKRDCEFSYRDSIFKNNKNLIILSATLQMKRGDKKEIENKIKKNLEQRNKTQPLSFPSAGSVFKNPRGFSAGELGEEDKSSSPATELLRSKSEGKEENEVFLAFAAARLIEECGLKGKKVGNVKISEIHSNFIVNLGRGTAKDVMRLIKIIKNKVKKKFGVVLEEEIQFLGF